MITMLLSSKVVRMNQKMLSFELATYQILLVHQILCHRPLSIELIELLEHPKIHIIKFILF